MATVLTTARAVSACADTPVVALQQHARAVARPGADDVHALVTGACRVMSDIGALRTCVVLLGDDGATGMVPVAGRGPSQDRLLGQPDVDGLLTHAVASGRTAATTSGRIVVVPLVAGTTVVGAIVGRRGRHAPPLGAATRQALTASAQLAAVAVQAQRSALRAERARHRQARLALARELHETVVQRLFAASLVLSAGGTLTAEEQRCCADEVQSALTELRAGLLRTAEPPAGDGRARLAEELQALTNDPGVHVSLTGDAPQLAAHQDAATRAVLAEAVRNARKHAADAPIHVAVHADRELLTLDVVNPAAETRAPDHTPGVGLRLAAAEVLEADGLLGHGPTGSGQWHVQLTVPHPGAAS